MGQEQPAVRHTLDAEELRAALTAAWLDRFGTPPSPRSITLLLAHVALETGMTSCVNFNIGNAKATVGGAADWCVFRTWEVEHGVKVPQDCAFRSFPDLATGAAFYLGLLFNQFRSAWPAVRAGDPQMFAVLLAAQRYYTAPVAEYAAGMRARFTHYWVMLAQSLLIGAGYPVAVDGALGPKTTEALYFFQGDANLPPSGAIDDATIAALQSAQVPPAPDTMPEVA